jgi:hypothetical protein
MKQLIDEFFTDLFLDPLGTLFNVAIWLLLFGVGLWLVIVTGKWVWTTIIQDAT